MEHDIASNEPVNGRRPAVNAVDGREPTSMRPLTTAVDPDVLDVLFAE